MNAHYYHDRHHNAYRVSVHVAGVRRVLYLGQVTARGAKLITAHLEALKVAAETGTEIPAATREWLATPRLKYLPQLQRWGLVPDASTMPHDLHGFCSAYMQSRDDWRPRTRSRMRNAVNHLQSQLSDRPLRQVTEADAKRFARWARANFASHSHSGKIISDVRQIFAAAVDERLIAANPFAGIDAGQQHDKTREHYVSSTTIDRIIAHANDYYAAVIATARYGGLRVPSELLTLRWTDIDWDAGRVTVTSPKTHRHKPTRVVPLFPKWRKHLKKIFDPTHVYVFHRARQSANRVYRSKLLELIEDAGETPWPKLWQNLRASCQTDLAAAFQDHVVCHWLGNSPDVKTKHYDRIHDGHYEQAQQWQK